MNYLRKLSVFGLFILSACNHQDTSKLEAGIDYPAYGGNNANNRYSPLDQINIGNVNKLELAWSYFANDTLSEKSAEIQCQPIMVNGILYGTSAELNLFALNAGTGEQIWKFEPREGRKYSHASRGVSYWEDGKDQRIYYSVGPFLYAIDAETGNLITSFGKDGSIDLHQGLAHPDLIHDTDKLSVRATSPGVIYKNTLIIGSSLSEGGNAAPGHIRAFDVLTGELKWVFHTIPFPNQFGYNTWPEEAYKFMGGVNSWGGMSLDEKRGVVYLSTGSPSSDFYGGDREGVNLFANCVLALDIETGERIWHFQAIHHDLWDRDFPSPPNLSTINYDGKEIDILVQVGKDGFVYILNRETGESIFLIEEIAVPTNGVSGEHAFPTQPQPSKPKPMNRQVFTEDDITNISPEAHEFVRQQFLALPKTTNRHQPPSLEGTLLFGYNGGAEWGGTSIDQEGILYVNANESPWILKMIDRESREKEDINLSRGHNLYLRNCAACHGIDREGNGDFVPSLINAEARKSREEISFLISTGNGRMPSFQYMSNSAKNALIDYLFNKEKDPKGDERVFTPSSGEDAHYEPKYTSKIWNRFTDQNGYNAIKPPWGTLNAIDLKTGEYLWRVPLGEFPELTAKGIPITGTENYGGPVVTAGGLIFIASTRDERIRAFDKKTGEVVWEYQLPAGGFATPISYEVDGKQFIVIAVGGARGSKVGGWYMGFSLK